VLGNFFFFPTTQKTRNVNEQKMLLSIGEVQFTKELEIAIQKENFAMFKNHFWQQQQP
jgi:hypothetical protein